MRVTVVVLLLVAGCGGSPTTTAPLPKVSELNSKDARATYIKELQDQKIITQIYAGKERPAVFVGPAWFMLSFDEKSRHMSVVFAYYEKPTIAIYDNTGNQIGQYYERGLVLAQGSSMN
jgi:hypothetical protein